MIRASSSRSPLRASSVDGKVSNWTKLMVVLEWGLLLVGILGITVSVCKRYCNYNSNDQDTCFGYSGRRKVGMVVSRKPHFVLNVLL